MKTMNLQQFVTYMDGCNDTCRTSPKLVLSNAQAEILDAKVYREGVTLKMLMAPKGATPDYTDPFLITLPKSYEITIY